MQLRRSCRLAEYGALLYLQLHGLHRIARNYTTRLGEIDLVMLDRRRHTLVFVEVRYRRNIEYGTPAETVTQAKRTRIRQAAKHFTKSHRIYRFSSIRFDVVSISRPNYRPHIHWIRNAF